MGPRQPGRTLAAPIGRSGNDEEDDRNKAAEEAKNHIRELVNLYPWKPEFPIKSTFRQLARYLDWWGQPVFEQGLRDSMT